jgi:cytochrome c oxidase subunit IV
MSEADRKPPAPIITRAMQLLGLGAIVLGTMILIDVRDCQELDCLAGPIGLFVVAWGVIALLSGLRGPVGLFCLIGAFVLTLLVAWIKFFIGIIALVALMGLTRLSKDRLAGYYRKQTKMEPV